MSLSPGIHPPEPLKGRETAILGREHGNERSSMAQPDYAAMSDDELRASYSAAEKEHKRRGQFHDAERHVRELLGNAVDLGIPRAKVEGFLNRLVNEYYPTA